MAQQPSPDDMLNQIGMLKRMEALQPDSTAAKFQLALACLNYAITFPQTAQTEPMLAQTEQAIEELTKMKDFDQSDLCTLRGFLLMARIVQNRHRTGRSTISTYRTTLKKRSK